MLLGLLELHRPFSAATGAGRYRRGCHLPSLSLGLGFRGSRVWVLWAIDEEEEQGDRQGLEQRGREKGK